MSCSVRVRQHMYCSVLHSAYWLVVYDGWGSRGAATSAHKSRHVDVGGGIPFRLEDL
jgi:hypothetical protein